MQKIKRDKGITLVGLIITIVVLIVLATVTTKIGLSTGKIIDKTGETSKTYQFASEKEYLEQNIISVQLKKNMGKLNPKKLGRSLTDRNSENSNMWDVVVYKSVTYGTGWNYVEKGTELENYGETQYNWLVNYETAELIKLEDGSYENLNYNQQRK